MNTFKIKCVICDTRIYAFNDIYRCCDTNVCSNYCTIARLHNVSLYDPSFSNSTLWTLIKFKYFKKFFIFKTKNDYKYIVSLHENNHYKPTLTINSKNNSVKNLLEIECNEIEFEHNEKENDCSNNNNNILNTFSNLLKIVYCIGNVIITNHMTSPE